LKNEGCTDFSAAALIDYLRQAIEDREYGKFVFTRSVSAILESIANWGNALGVSKEVLSHLSISEVKYFQDETPADPQVILEHLTKAVDENKEKWKLSRSIRLPQLLADCEGVDVVPFQVSQPNFISTKKITGEVMFLDAGFTSDQISGKVILIENADPGFDWIFSQEIIALITKYGGANSHMAIRCAEFGIPAAIGCGEQRFEALKKARSVALDCSSRILTPLFQKDLK
jgi:phosphohistidine swiveling domain-containing protein